VTNSDSSEKVSDVPRARRVVAATVDAITALAHGAVLGEDCAKPSWMLNRTDVTGRRISTRPRVRFVLVLGCAVVLCLGGNAAGKRPARSMCKHGTVPVKVEGKTHCQKLRGAIPRPRPGDPRVGFFQAALGANVSVARDRHGRRLKPLAQLMGGRAYRAISHNLPGALTRLDDLAAPRAASDRARASSGCGSSGPSSSSSYSGSDGTSVGLTQNSDGSASVQMSTDAGNGLRVSIDFDISQCNFFKVPPCPTADGKLDGTDKHPLRVRIVVSKGAATVRSEAITANSGETLHGDVADDAKLDELIINDTSSFSFVVAGSEVGHVFSERARISRQAIVNMRFGYPTAFNGAVNITGSIDGVPLSPAERAAEELRTKANFDKEFAQIIKEEVDRFRMIETGFNKPNACAKVSFTPRSNTRTLQRGQNSTFSSKVGPKGGGTSPGRWKLVSSQNARITPTRPRGTSPTFSVTVATIRSGASVIADFEVKSKAGVARDKWTQRITGAEPPIVKISGNFSGGASAGGGDFTWEGGATFVPLTPATHGATNQYLLTTGTVTYHADGKALLYGFNCTMHGSKQISLPARSGSVGVFGSPPDGDSPYTYSASITLPAAAGTMDVVLSNCADPSANDMHITISLFGQPLQTAESNTSADGLTYDGDYTSLTDGSHWSWTMKGQPAPGAS
jgi:uncharacterized membrane protein YgcG